MSLKSRTVVAAIAALVSFGPIGPQAAWAPGPAAYAAPKLSDLKSVDELKTLFNRDRGKPRLVLLLSPT